MQNIIVEKPYRFMPPHQGNWIPNCIQALHVVDWYLKKFEGIESFEVRGAERLRDSLRQRNGILLAPNHCRYADPIAMGWIARAAKVHVYTMASWHLFNQHWLQTLAIRWCGGFSINREGVDKQSLDAAINILTEAKRPLIVFAEGTVFRTNDVLQEMLDGIGFLARTAAKRKQKQDGGKVVIHPVAIKYLFKGDFVSELTPTVQRLEKRFAISGHAESLEVSHEELLRRVNTLTESALALKEVQYYGQAKSGDQFERRQSLGEYLLSGCESEWLGKTSSSEPTIARIKQLRMKILPRLIAQPSERDRCWDALARVYVAQLITAYPREYSIDPTQMQVMETIERLDEDLNDYAAIHRPLHAILEVGEAIEVGTEKPPRGEADPVMVELEKRLSESLSKLAQLSPKWLS